MKLKIALVIAAATAMETRAFSQNRRSLSFFFAQGITNKNSPRIDRVNNPYTNIGKNVFTSDSTGSTIAFSAHKSKEDSDNTHNNNNNNDDEEDDFPMEELYERIANHRRKSNSYSELLNKIHNAVGQQQQEGKNPSPYNVHVILFHADTDNEGLHAIEYPPGSGKNSVLAFETKMECEAFARELREQEFFDPQSRMMKLSFLREHCDSIGINLKIVPRGMELRPPTDRVEELMYNPELVELSVALDLLFKASKGALGARDSLASGGVLVGEGTGSWD